MTGKSRHSRARRLPLLGMALYVLFLVASPFEHHDIICHLKTPQHCTTCAFTQLGSDPHPPVTLGAWQLSDAGRAVSIEILAESTLLGIHSSGRSPPAVL